MLRSTFLVIPVAGLLAGCSFQPSPNTAERFLAQQVATESQNQIKLISFRKTDGQKFEMNGVQGYKMDFEAEMQFSQNGLWISQDRLNYGHGGFTWVFKTPSAQNSWAQFMDSIGGGIPVAKGSKARISGELIGEKKESGWVFSAGAFRVTTMPAEPTIAASAAQHGVAGVSAGQQANPAELRNQCVNILRQIDVAKQQWALENSKTFTDVPAVEALKPYLGRGKQGKFPVCPAGGKYTLNAVDTKPTCSIPDHNE